MNNKNKMNINQVRKEIRIKLERSIFKNIKTITAINIKSINNPDATFEDLMKLVSDKGIILQAIGTVSKNKGALTVGPPEEPITCDGTSMDLVNELSNELKTGNFKFKPIRRIYIEKSSKDPFTTEKNKELKNIYEKGKVLNEDIKKLGIRPLGVSSFPDKVVQEILRMILNAIYEPEFQRMNLNFGFRPGLGCCDAVLEIQNKAKQMDYAIEGDIKGAFDNVDHDILISILKRKIKDDKFISLIKGGLKCGIIYLNFKQSSDLGTTQGSVVSPILYNIYFNEFDKFINNEFKKKINNINILENRKDRPINKLYNILSKRKSKLGLKQILIDTAAIIKNPNSSKEEIIKANELKKEKLKKYNEIDKEQKKVPAFALSRQTIRFMYCRYADDWVLFTNANLEKVVEWKELFAKWIKENLNLTLSLEKTKITDLRKGEYVKFLGFQLSRPAKRKSTNIVKVGLMKKTRTDPLYRQYSKEKVQDPETKLIYKTRSANPTLNISWDRKRILERMETNGFIEKHHNTYRGRSKLPWTILKEPEIIQRFNYIIRGYINYYTPVMTHSTDILFLYYLLKFSAAHTIAQKRNISLRDVFKKFGKDLKVNYEIITTNKKLNKETKIKKQTNLLTWKQIVNIIEYTLKSTRIKQNKKKAITLIGTPIDKITNVKINWRTAYKLSTYCPICGSTEKIQYHHVKHIKKGKVAGFLQIMNQLNRKQIPCCWECHKKIHRGEYDNLSLSELYDEELIIL
jgi:retron-type reverse transcriptase